jgi:hypothetical protein
MTYLGLEPETFGYQVGNATNWTIEVVIHVIQMARRFSSKEYIFYKRFMTFYT